MTKTAEIKALMVGMPHKGIQLIVGIGVFLAGIGVLLLVARDRDINSADQGINSGLLVVIVTTSLFYFGSAITFVNYDKYS